MLWITSEIFYYLGLVLVALFIPALTLILWMMSMVDKIEPNYWYLFIAWILSLLIFITGVGIKNFIYSLDDTKEDK